METDKSLEGSGQAGARIRWKRGLGFGWDKGCLSWNRNRDQVGLGDCANCDRHSG